MWNPNRLPWAAAIFASLVSLVLAYYPVANAAVASVSGTVSIENNPFPPEADGQIFVFDEQQGVSFVSTQPLDFGNIAAGTLVNSHYVQFDPASPIGFVGIGSITFTGRIIGVITTTSNLNADLNPDVAANSDTYFGLQGALGLYPTGAIPGSRGLGSPEDDLVVVIGSFTLTIDSLEIPAGSPGNLDGFRVLTAVPLPPTLVLLIFGLLAVTTSRRFRAQ